MIVSSEQIGYAKEDLKFWQELQGLHYFEPQNTIFRRYYSSFKTAEKFGIRHLFTILQPSTLKSKRQLQDLEYKALDQLTELLSILNQTDRKDNDVKIA